MREGDTLNFVINVFMLQVSFLCQLLVVTQVNIVTVIVVGQILQLIFLLLFWGQFDVSDTTWNFKDCISLTLKCDL